MLNDKGLWQEEVCLTEMRALFADRCIQWEVLRPNLNPDLRTLNITSILNPKPLTAEL